MIPNNESELVVLMILIAPMAILTTTPFEFLLLTITMGVMYVWESWVIEECM